jgi:hypothetical protein
LGDLEAAAALRHVRTASEAAVAVTAPSLGSIVRYQGYLWEVVCVSERWTGAVSLGLWREGGETRSGVPAGDVELEGSQAPLFTEGRD